MAIQLVKAGAADIPLITKLATEIWQEHYPSIISREQISYMLGKMYSAENLRKQLLEDGHEYFLIQKNNENAGFVSVSTDDSKNWMLHKFYILANARGIGSEAFKQLLILLNNPETIRLTVNRQNYKSINFYFKNGFRIEKVADFDIGDGYFMNDFVMILERFDKPHSA